MSSHTKGKWTLDTKDGSVRSDGHLVAQVYGATEHNYEANAEECFANARLITYTPEMYSLLRAFADSQTHEVSCLKMEARALLRKVEQ